MQGNELYLKCDLCGKKENYANNDYVHLFAGFAGTGSAYNGEYITLHFCSECLDKMINGSKSNEVKT